MILARPFSVLNCKITYNLDIKHIPSGSVSKQSRGFFRTGSNSSTSSPVRGSFMNLNTH